MEPSVPPDPHVVAASAWSSAREIGVLPSLPDAETRLTEYVRLMMLWQTRVNLTGWRTEGALVDGLVGALALARLLPPGAAVVADLGSGNGVPALPCSLVRPDLRWRLVEPRRTRAAFLLDVVRAWGRAGPIEVCVAAAEQLPLTLRRDVVGVTSRGLWPVPKLLARSATLFPSLRWAVAYPTGVPPLPGRWSEAERLDYRTPGGAPGTVARYELP
ncbi:class I SAM-dependent methyltransferase [Myxococcota bacterium]|nr:class I SAM-dependent methyltransferase [Myxococcota bacterium]